jgi:hypothetical protein
MLVRCWLIGVVILAFDSRGVSGGVKMTGSVVEVEDIRDATSSPGPAGPWPEPAAEPRCGDCGG